jgi:uncharacterized protein (DUF2126 family)
MLKEGNLPENVDPVEPQAERPGRARRMARVFERGLTTPSGYVLPVQRWNARASGALDQEKWKLRRGKLFLAPATARSAIACRCRARCLTFRLPLSLYRHPADPMEPRAAADSRYRADPAAAG